jgi:hypothetical protein
VNVMVSVRCQMVELFNELSVWISRRRITSLTYLLCNKLAVSATGIADLFDSIEREMIRNEVDRSEGCVLCICAKVMMLCIIQSP